MAENSAIDWIARQDWLEGMSAKVQPAVLNVFKSGGASGHAIKNFLHGTWLGHPLHPVLTDVPLGAWTVTVVLDGLELTGHNQYTRAADAALTIGLVGAAGAAVTGLTDWTGTSGRRRKIGMFHGLLNVGAVVLFASSGVLRRRNQRSAGIGLALLGYALTTCAAYLGGQLVYGEQVGVDHTATAQEPPRQFVAVLPESELAEGQMTCAQAGEMHVLLARKNGQIFALEDTCSHMGGPLHEGTLLDDASVRCPWHGSRFDLQSGAVLDGPAAAAQPKFDVRVRNGQIEIRLANIVHDEAESTEPAMANSAP